MSLSDLPLLNAVLNGLSASLLVVGYVMIKRRKPRLHRAFMISALVSSTAFLISYLVYHANVGSVRFPGIGIARTVYFSILVSHTLLAACVPVLAIMTASRALRRRFDRHIRIARWTLPVWLYVSVTGVIIYLMLYRIYPHAL